MADIKGANIAKLVTKQAGRAKEKLLQNLGKADKTTEKFLRNIISISIFNKPMPIGFKRISPITSDV